MRMGSSEPDGRCELCGGSAGPLNPLVPQEFYPGVLLHLHCLNSPAGASWTQARADDDPAYARYLSLITLGQRIDCSACGSNERLSPKAIGMGAGHWESSCRACHRHRPHVNAYRSPLERELHEAIGKLAHEFRFTASPAEILNRVERLAIEADPLLPAGACTCGDRFSLAAHPRCSHCGEVLLESPFHVTITPTAPVDTD